MTLDEARAQVGARVTHQATGIIHDVTDHFVWIRYDGDGVVAKSARPEDLTLTEAVDEPVDGAR